MLVKEVSDVFGLHYEDSDFKQKFNQALKPLLEAERVGMSGDYVFPK